MTNELLPTNKLLLTATNEADDCSQPMLLQLSLFLPLIAGKNIGNIKNFFSPQQKCQFQKLILSDFENIPAEIQE